MLKRAWHRNAESLKWHEIRIHFEPEKTSIFAIQPFSGLSTTPPSVQQLATTIVFQIVSINKFMAYFIENCYSNTFSNATMNVTLNPVAERNKVRFNSGALNHHFFFFGVCVLLRLSFATFCCCNYFRHYNVYFFTILSCVCDSLSWENIENEQWNNQVLSGKWIRLNAPHFMDQWIVLGLLILKEKKTTTTTKYWLKIEWKWDYERGGRVHHSISSVTQSTVTKNVKSTDWNAIYGSQSHTKIGFFLYYILNEKNSTAAHSFHNTMIHGEMEFLECYGIC